MRRTLALGLALLSLLAATTAAAATSTATTPQRQPAGRAEAGRVEQVSKTIGYLDGQGSATFRYPGAEYLKVHFANVLLLPGDYLIVRSRDGVESHRVTKPGWAMSVLGDTAIVELHRSSLLSGTIAQLGVRIDQVARGFTRQERKIVSDTHRAEKARTGRNGREESVCGLNDSADAVCYRTTDPMVYRSTKAVVRLLINGVELCTAFRVGKSNRLLTNQHCIATQQEAANTEVWFNYQCAECGGYEVFRPTKVWLDKVLATDDILDFTLFSVTDFDLVSKFGWLNLDVRRPTRGEKVYIPQHPSGAPAQIAIGSDRDYTGNCMVYQSSYYGYDSDTDISYFCDTEGGSSGSPVLSRDSNAVVALHHFGGCPNSGVRVDRIYPFIKSLL